MFLAIRARATSKIRFRLIYNSALTLKAVSVGLIKLWTACTLRNSLQLWLGFLLVDTSTGFRSD